MKIVNFAKVDIDPKETSSSKNICKGIQQMYQIKGERQQDMRNQ